MEYEREGQISMAENQQQHMAPVASTERNVDEARSRKRRRIARRALITTGALGVCAAGAALTPTLVKDVGQASGKAASDAFQAGVDAGRQALLDELAQLEGVTLDAAIDVAEVTRVGVKVVVLPVARLVSTIGGDALAGLALGLSQARSDLAHINIHIGVLDALQALVLSWQQNLTQLPIQLSDYATTDINGAETYLKALRTTLQKSQRITPTPGK